jgi:restriction endonuclease S subunit
MSGKWESISFAELIAERKGRFEPDAPEIRGLPKIDKIDFAEGRLHLGEYEPTKTQQIIVEPGDFVFSGLNIEKGAAGFNQTGGRLVVSANYSTCSYNDSRVSLDFFKHYMRSANFQRLLKANLKKDYGFTRPKHLMPLTFLVPADKAEQHRIVGVYESCKATHSELNAEVMHQQSLLAKLKQAILQEAIEGKLTSDWRASHPEVEPASALLERIQAEKASMIAAKKLRPEKPLPKITPAEIPFEIPKGWEWCRLGNVARYLNGYAFKSQWFVPEGIRLVRNTNVSHGKLDWSDTACIPRARLTEFDSFQLSEGDIVLSLDRPIISTGLKAARIDSADLPALLLQRVLQIQPVALSGEYVFKWLFSSLFQRSINPGRSIGVPHVSHNEVMKAPFPLPPLAEQVAIVERVESLMANCRALESEIEQTRTHATHLLQAVLKEAFAPAST